MGAAFGRKSEAEGDLGNHRAEGNGVAQENGAAYTRSRVDLSPLARTPCPSRCGKGSQKEQEKEEGKKVRCSCH